MSSFVFTSSLAPQAQATPDLFKRFKIQGQIPGPILESQILPASLVETSHADLSVRVVVPAVQTLLLQAPITYACPEYGSVLGTDPITSFQIAPPPVVVDFGRDNNSDRVSTEMLALSFRKESQGMRTYYKGELTPAKFDQLFALSPSLSTFAPFGACSVKGYFAAMNAQKILFGICGVWGADERGHLSMYDSGFQINRVSPRKFVITPQDTIDPAGFS